MSVDLFVSNRSKNGDQFLFCLLKQNFVSEDKWFVISRSVLFDMIHTSVKKRDAECATQCLETKNMGRFTYSKASFTKNVVHATAKEIQLDTAGHANAIDCHLRS